MIIGSKYEETKIDLVQKINDNKISISIDMPKNHVCYFCQTRIDEVMFVLEDNYVQDNIERISRFFIDESCYKKATDQGTMYN